MIMTNRFKTHNKMYQSAALEETLKSGTFQLNLKKMRSDCQEEDQKTSIKEDEATQAESQGQNK